MTEFKQIFPSRISIGDTIGIVAPSKPIYKEDEGIDLGIKFLHELGFKTLLGKHVGISLGEEKAEDLNSMFSNEDVKAIIFARGGDSAKTALPFLDIKTIKKNPKIMCGYSDATVLLNGLNTNPGLVSFYANDVNSFGRTAKKYDIKRFMDTFVEGKGKGDIPLAGKRKTIRAGKCTGRILGGHIHCILELEDTDFWPDFKDAILILESYKIPEKDNRWFFSRLKKLGVFDKIAGAVVGYIYSDEVIDKKSIKFEQILLEETKDYDFPILKTSDFGHMCSHAIMPIGAKAKLDSESKKLTILDSPVI